MGRYRILLILLHAETAEAPDNKNTVVNHCDAEVTAGGVHGGHVPPGVGARVVGLSSLETGGPIETTNL